MARVNRGVLLRKARQGKLEMVRSYHFDGRGGGRYAGDAMPVRIRDGYSDNLSGFCNLWESDFRGKAGCAYDSPDGTITLIVHSNCNYTMRYIDPKCRCSENAKIEQVGPVPHYCPACDGDYSSFLASSNCD